VSWYFGQPCGKTCSHRMLADPADDNAFDSRQRSAYGSDSRNSMRQPAGPAATALAGLIHPHYAAAGLPRQFHREELRTRAKWIVTRNNILRRRRACMGGVPAALLSIRTLRPQRIDSGVWAAARQTQRLYIVFFNFWAIPLRSAVRPDGTGACGRWRSSPCARLPALGPRGATEEAVTPWKWTCSPMPRKIAGI